jgi:murein DD-endopeptidase MepM/ murein hydrolase activator NlpD
MQTRQITITAAVVVLVVVLLLMLRSCGGDDDAETAEEPSVLRVEPPLVTEPIEVFHEVAQDQTFGEICTAHGIPYSEMLQMVTASEEIHELTRIRVGKILQLRFDPHTDALTELAYPLDDNSWIVMTRGEDGLYTGAVEVIPYEVEYAVLTSQVTTGRNSFWAMCEHMELNPADIISLAEIFEYDVDFATEVRLGDKVAVWIERLSLDGSFRKYGSVLAARYINDGRASEALHFTPTDDKPGYYTDEGMSTRKQFLRSPLKFSRVASGFSRSRFHPVLHTNRPHWGTDFSAPKGTPIRALGDGRVTFAGWRGGYGNLVIIQHDERHSTRYGHCTGFARGVRSGTNVEQGQTIATVGSTGMSTGPHLHFEFRVNGNPVDFMKQEFPNTEPVNKEDMPRFEAERDALLVHLDAVLPRPPQPPAEEATE